MRTTIAFLLAAGHLATAQESQFSYSPRATTSDDNLATITTLSDGHLPTCFTNHPTHPCPTDEPNAKRDITQELNNALHNMPLPIDPISVTADQGSISPPSLPSETPEPVAPEPVAAKRDAPVEEGNGDYIPQPSEWAIPGNFTFTDTISNGTTGTAASTVSLTISSSEKIAIASATSHSDSYIKADSNYDASAIIKSATRDAAPEPISHAAALPSISSIEQHSSANASSNAHLSGTIGTLLSQAMFPGKMRAPTTTLSQASAPATTQAPSAEHLEPIPISQKPNTTAPNASLQAFVHTINTEDLAAQQSASSSALYASASATTVAQKSEGSDQHYKLAASSSETVQKATVPSAVTYSENAEAKSGKNLHGYLHSSASQEPSTTASYSRNTVEATPMALAPVNDTQVVTRINTHTAVTLIEAEPTAAPQAYEKAHHHHPRARRFIS